MEKTKDFDEMMEGGSYEIIQQRLKKLNNELLIRIDKLNNKRKKVFGALESRPLGTDRIMTGNNCVPRDIISIGNYLIFGYNVFIGLKKETIVPDVFSVYSFNDDKFESLDAPFFKDQAFLKDFNDQYSYYRETRFATFRKMGSVLLMIFQTGKKAEDIKAFKWQITADNNLKYLHNRADREYTFPPQQDFEWTKTARENYIRGEHPHVSIEDRVFVETIGGDLTVKVENNTASGEGIYSEPVEKPDQTLDDGEIFYSILGSIIILKILPYQEKDYRYIIFEEKRKQAIRVDDIAKSAVRLPGDDGLIFPGGYYLPDQGYKVFKIDTTNMKYLKIIPSPNGEDYLYVFYNEDTGEYILLQYNIINKQVEKPITCNGFTVFEDGRMIFFKEGQEPARSHGIQIWQTPFVADEGQIKTDETSYLTKIGNRDLVRGISDLRAVYNLLQTEKVYQGMYHDIARRVASTMDLHFWLSHEEAFNPKEMLLEIRGTANSAIDEFEKVLQIKKNTAERMQEAQKDTKSLVRSVSGVSFDRVDKYVDAITGLKTQLGSIISLKDVRYADTVKLEELEATLREAVEKVSLECTDFLLREDSFAPYINDLDKISDKIPGFSKSTDMKETGEELTAQNAALDLLTDLVNTLKIDDAVKTTTIIESISTVYSKLNRVKADFKNHRKGLLSGEMGLEFTAQFKLIGQTVMNFMDQAVTPVKCDDLLTRILVQIEELEGKFSDFEEFVEKLSAKREEVYSTFNNKKIQLEEVLNNRINSLATSAGRIIKSISNRMNTIKTVEELNGYFASDRMVEKVRDIIARLFDAGASVKAEDVSGRLKSMQQDGIRQLKDRIDLYTGGENIISLGKFRFTVNTQSFGLTTVFRDEALYYHLSGTDFFERITHGAFNETRAFWGRRLVSETSSIYRSAYLAYRITRAIEEKKITGWDSSIIKDKKKLVKIVRDFSSGLYDEGYDKGVHDIDAAKILMVLHPALNKAGTLKYHPLTRAYGAVYWFFSPETAKKRLLAFKLESLALINKGIATDTGINGYIKELDALLRKYYADTFPGTPERYLAGAAEFITHELVTGEKAPTFTIHKSAFELYENFNRFMTLKNLAGDFKALLKAAENDIATKMAITADWLRAFLHQDKASGGSEEYIPEAATLILADKVLKKQVKPVKTRFKISGLSGEHSKIENGTLALDICSFLIDMYQFHTVDVPAYREYIRLKQELTEARAAEMRLSEFKPGILTSFVRNKLIDKVYLPLIGTNLAKQMGAYGEEKRTDLMGLLLLISPPGYGKTTLMEYIANRLGLIFMKINAPAIGHGVTSLDPAEAPNVTAKKEVEKLNLALEMGNNVMLYVDDIQHSNPEFLQKFISLCDAQRKIEGIFKGETKTYDLRGKKFCVVMAGNPYTESGEKFRIPDMLANRADTYNLGDILGGYEDAFNLSYLENALTSNTVLNKLATRSQHDVYEMVKIAQTGSSEGADFEAKYSMEEIKEFVAIFEKLLVIQGVVIKVNQLYIYSAGQDEDYRKEPSFLLQGSYRNMNRMAEKVVPIMNEAELKQVILDHYTDESQLLTSGAEFNLLRFKEETAWILEEEIERLAFIRKTFQKNKSLGKVKDGDAMGQLIGQINLFNDRFSGFVDVVKKQEK